MVSTLPLVPPTSRLASCNNEVGGGARVRVHRDPRVQGMEDSIRNATILETTSADLNPKVARCNNYAGRARERVGKIMMTSKGHPENPPATS